MHIPCKYSQIDHSNVWEGGGLLINTGDSAISGPSAETSGLENSFADTYSLFGTITSHSAELQEAPYPRASVLLATSRPA